MSNVSGSASISPVKGRHNFRSGKDSGGSSSVSYPVEHFASISKPPKSEKPLPSLPNDSLRHLENISNTTDSPNKTNRNYRKPSVMKNSEEVKK